MGKTTRRRGKIAKSLKKCRVTACFKDIRTSVIIESLKYSVDAKRTSKATVKSTTTHQHSTTGKDKCQKKYARKKISAATLSKWQSVPHNLQKNLISVLEDAISPFNGCGNDATEDALCKIRNSIQCSIRKIKIPVEKWTDVKSLHFAQENLVAEKRRLDILENTLTSTFEQQVRQLKRLQTKRSRLNELARRKDEQLQCIIRKLQESP